MGKNLITAPSNPKFILPNVVPFNKPTSRLQHVIPHVNLETTTCSNKKTSLMFLKVLLI